MATITTITTKSGPGATAPPMPSTAQFKSHVYSKYRELLGSYNGKANEMLQAYPAYRVQEDKGFALGGVVDYGGPPQSTIGSSARRIQAQLPAEPPACVQNAMMRRDKQPFTYTPGGIDLSQIKSPRMAKRISRNANSEGVTGQPKASPLAQNNGNGASNGSHNPVSPAATLGAAAMGMPFQVFPTGPPAPPPPPPTTQGRLVQPNGNRSIPPPPPPPGPTGPGPIESRKSPKPQVFEPPPMGMRPEIKIPVNPLANLRKAPRPQPKNDYWIEEYRREKQQDGGNGGGGGGGGGSSIPRPVPPSYSYPGRDLDDEVAKNTVHNRTDELTVRGEPLAQKRSPSPSNLTKPHENGSRGSSIKTPPVYGQSPVPANLPPPITPTKVSPARPATAPSPGAKDLPSPPAPPPVLPKPSVSPVPKSQPTNNSHTITITTQAANGGRPEPTAVVVRTGADLAAPSPPPPPSPQVPTQKPSTVAASSASSSSPTSVTQKPAQALGSLYIPPVHEVFANSKQSLLTQASPPWMSSRHNSLKEQPEWVHRDDPGAGDEAGRERRRSQSPPCTPPESEQTEPQSQQPQQQTQTDQTGQATRDSGTKSVDSIATASSPVSAGARPSPASYQLTQQTAPAAPAPPGSASAARPSVDVSAPQPYAQQQLRGQGQQQPQQQQQPNRVGPAVGVSPVTVTMPVARPYQQPHGPPQGPQGYSQAQPVYSPQPPTTAGPQKERIIPIQIEKSPVQSPATAPSFAPPPYYSPSATYGPGSANGSTMQMQSPVPLGFATPHSGFTTPTAMFTNPNHFVNQGYNNISYPPTPTGQPIQPIYQAAHPHYPPPLPPTHHHPMHGQQQRMQQQQQQQCVSNVRIVPIKVEATAEHTARGPLANTPAIIQSGDRSYIIHDIPLEAKIRFLKNRLSDPRSSNNAQAWNGNNAPNQSRSFRVLQQITDTLEESGESAKNGSKEPGSGPQPAAGDQTDAKPAYGRTGARTPTGGQQQDLGDGQLRRLQLSNEDKALMNRVKNQVDGEVYLHNEEDPRYRGAAIPSKAFRYLQNMTDMSGQAANQSTTGSGNRAQQMFIPSRPSCNESDGDNQQSQPYVPPSEQTVEEPKKYTGGSIPSRSFKMLQAMTDAPADPNSSDTEGQASVKLQRHCSGTEIRYSPYPYPPQPTYYCCTPNWHHYYDPTNPQYYPTHHPHHPPPPHAAPGYYYGHPPPPPPPPPPPLPPGLYDRGGGGGGGGYYGGYMSPHHFYYAQEPCSPCTPPPYYQISQQQPQTAYCEAIPHEAIHTYVITTPPPRIVVTPTPATTDDSDSELQRKEQLGELHAVPGDVFTDGGEYVVVGGGQQHHPLVRSRSSMQRLSERLADLSPSAQTVRCSPCSPLNERYRTYEESTSSSVPSSQSEASDSEDEGTQRRSNGHAGRGKAAAQTAQTATETEEDDNEDEGDEEEEEDDESEEEDTAQTADAATEEHLPHQLSVIFEEESMYGQSTVASSRRASVCSNSSTLSDCSSTLANDLDDDGDGEEAALSGGNRTDDDIDRLDDADMERSLVSVRLPLKLSFSKSPNNEDIATLVVGESEITGSKETVTKPKRPAQPEVTNRDDSGDESDTEESDSESDSGSGAETDTDVKKDGRVPTDAADSADVTVTITIPSLTSKSKSGGDQGGSGAAGRTLTAKHDEPGNLPFKIDYEEASEVSVSVSLPLKPKLSSCPEVAGGKSNEKESLETAEPEVAKDQEQDGEEEVDFWSQIGDDEDDYQRPVRSYSREMWSSSREFSVDRQSAAEDDEEGSTTGMTEFWSAENVPTEAVDHSWKHSALETMPSDAVAPREQSEFQDSLEYWQKENERLVKDLYESRSKQSSALAMDENNNNRWAVENTKQELQEPQVAIALGNPATEPHCEEEGTESESDEDSEEYQSSNASKEESELEQEANQQQKAVSDPQVNDVEEKLCNGLTEAAGDKLDKDKKLSVKERISLFETQAIQSTAQDVRATPTPAAANRLRPPSRQRLSYDESEAEDDSGVTSDISKHISEVETDSECFPEMRKMTRYQRAATHSRLFKLLQDESNNGDSEDEEASGARSSEAEGDGVKLNDRPASSGGVKSERPHKMPAVAGDLKLAEKSPNIAPAAAPIDGRRDRLTLPISKQSSSGNDSLSSSTSSTSPVSGSLHNEKLAEELVQSLLMKKKGRLFRNLPLEKLHAAALKILQEDLESNGTISSTEDNLATVDSTPALTPQEFKAEYPHSYADYYDTWNSGDLANTGGYQDNGSDSAGMVKLFRTVPEHQLREARKDPRMANGGTWSPRCPRVFSNKNVPRLAEVREAEIPESPRGSRPPSRASNNRSPCILLAGPVEDYPHRNTAIRQFKLQ